MKIECDCGQTIEMIPHRDYFGEEWAGCHVRQACGDCPLTKDTAKFLAKVNEVFGDMEP